MSEIKINSISGNNNVIGDNNTIQNQMSQGSVLLRDDYFQMINEIRELERISVGTYLEDKYEKFGQKNPDFIKCLYKDIYKVLDGVAMEGDNDLAIENGDFVIEYGDIKSTGYQSNLVPALTWLHMALIKEFSKNNKNPMDLFSKLERFENDFLKVDYDTPAYSQKLAGLNISLRQERKQRESTCNK